MDGTILVADDDRTIRTVLTQALSRAGCKVHATSSLTTLLRWVSEGKGDAVICDVMMPDGNGIEMLPSIHQTRPDLPVIIISAQNTIMTTIKANEADAFDYLPKPFDLPDLMKRTARALASKGSEARAPSEDPVQDALPLIGKTPVMQDLYQVIARVMNADMPVLISGESGTGKSKIARMLHDLSDRRSLPFVILSEADFNDLDAPARIMARVKGGTLLIDEVADISLDAQARLVAMMDSAGEDGPRFVATSQVDLAQHLQAGTFRQDLYYRLCAALLEVPPLRQRIEDIDLLLEHFLQQAEGQGLATRQVSPEARASLKTYSWPGNVRQLENAVRRLTMTPNTDIVSHAEVDVILRQQPVTAPAQAGHSNEKLADSVERHLRRYFDLHGSALPPSGLYQRILREIELPLIEIALDATAGNQAKCADLLGINRNTLRKKITELDIRVTRRRKLM